MLKLVAGFVAGATILTVGTVSAFASSQGNYFEPLVKTRVYDTASCNAQCYVDADGNGVCDNWGTHGKGMNFVDADDNGVCDNLGTGTNGYSQNYVDADNDGVCDNWGTGANGFHGNGNGNGNGRRAGRNG